MVPLMAQVKLNINERHVNKGILSAVICNAKFNKENEQKEAIVWAIYLALKWSSIKRFPRKQTLKSCGFFYFCLSG